MYVCLLCQAGWWQAGLLVSTGLIVSNQFKQHDFLRTDKHGLIYTYKSFLVFLDQSISSIESPTEVRGKEDGSEGMNIFLFIFSV